MAFTTGSAQIFRQVKNMKTIDDSNKIQRPKENISALGQLELFLVMPFSIHVKYILK